jgi:hypothetical protein
LRRPAFRLDLRPAMVLAFLQTMNLPVSCELFFGPYHPPLIPRSRILRCERRGRLPVGDLSQALIPWPMRRGKHSEDPWCPRIQPRHTPPPRRGRTPEQTVHAHPPTQALGPPRVQAAARPPCAPTAPPACHFRGCQRSAHNMLVIKFLSNFTKSLSKHYHFGVDGWYQLILFYFSERAQHALGGSK